jgi:hypothetical protein
MAHAAACYSNYKTVHRRFQAWCRNEALRRVLTDIANELRERGSRNFCILRSGSHIVRFIDSPPAGGMKSDNSCTA